jgi:lipid A 3-O-deacylase
MNHRAPLLLAAIASLAAATISIAAEDTPVNAISIRYENDIFGGTDRYYTNGASAAWTRSAPGDWLLNPLWKLLKLPAREGHRETLGFELAQVMNSPSDIKLVNPPLDDRMYCGLLTFGTSLQVEREGQLDVLKVYAGVVGPGSLAEETQKWVHKNITNSPEPMGWDTQVKSEFAINLVYERRGRILLAGERTGFTVDFIPSGAAMLGNVFTQAQINGQLRAGWRVPEDFGTSLLRGAGNLPPPAGVIASRGVERGWGFYFFAGANGNAVAYNIALDGNFFREAERSVEKEPFYTGLELGAVLTTRHFQGTFTWVRWSEEFEGQKDASIFGAITVSVLF